MYSVTLSFSLSRRGRNIFKDFGRVDVLFDFGLMSFNIININLFS